MTKHSSSEDVLKCPLDLDESNKFGRCADNLLEKNALAIGGAQVTLTEDDKVKITLVKAKKAGKRGVKQSQLEKATEKLYNLEPCSLPEKPLNVDLDLYQMEDY